MKIRQISKAAALGAAVGLLLPLVKGLARPTDENEKKMNVLMIAVDDLKPTLGVYGDKSAISPHIDQLAAQGVAFKRAYVQQAVCGPSRASLMSGLRPDTTGVTRLRFKLRDKMPQVLTLPEHFKKNGYHTESAGKIYHHYEEDKQGWSQPEWHAKNQFPGYANPVNVEWNRTSKKKYRQIKREKGAKAAKPYKNNGPPTESYDAPDSAYPDYKIASHAIERLRVLKNKKEPFFLAVGFVKPHLPFAAPKKYWDKFDRDKLPSAKTHALPRGAPALAGQPGWELKNGYSGFENEQSPVSPELAKELVHGYYACVSFVDAQVGRVLQALKKEGLDKNTIVVLYGDHGWHLGDHGIWCKHTNFEQATRAPLIIVNPRAKSRDVKSGAVVEFVDIYPTLAELAGLSVPKQLEGSSLAALLDNPSQKSFKKAAFSQFTRWAPGNMGYTLRTERYRYTEWVDKWGGKAAFKELYDYEKDPLETKSLADDPAYDEVLTRMQILMAGGWQGARP